MSRLSVSRRARLGITAGVLATASVAAAFSIGTANAATNADAVLVNFANTGIQSVRVHGPQEDGTLTSKCVTRDPRAAAMHAGLNADVVLVQSFTGINCTGTKLHSDTVSHASDADNENFWVIRLETLDDDDPDEWTQPPAHREPVARAR